MPSELDIVLDRAPKAVEFRPLPKVKKTHPHRSDVYYSEQVREVRQCQRKLTTLIKQMDSINSEEELAQRKAEIDAMKLKIDQLIVMLKVTTKIHSEMVFARERMQTAIRTGESTEEIRKRLFWLEGRLEKLLDKEKSPQVLPKPAILPPPIIDADQEETKGPRSYSDIMRDLDGMTEVLDEHAAARKREEEASVKPERKEEEEAPGKPEWKEEEVSVKPEQKEEEEASLKPEQKKEEEEEVSLKPELKEEEERTTFLTECREPRTTDDSEDEKEEEEESLKVSDSEDEDTQPRGDDEASTELPSRVASVQAEKPAEIAVSQDASCSNMAADSYWESEHHRHRFVENAGVLVELDPTSYHNLAIVEPGTYVEEASDRKATLPWRPRRRDSEFEEIHKDALNSLVKRVHNMYTDLHDAAMLSVDPHYKDQAAKGTFLDHLEANKDDIMDDQELALPELKVPRKAGFGRVYYPTPLLAPVKLPTAKLDRTKRFPPKSSRYSETALGEEKPACRIVNQGALFDETRFTSSLFRKRRGGRAQAGGFGAVSSAEERRLKDWVRTTGSAASGQSAVHRSEEVRSTESEERPRRGFKNRVQAVRGAQKFALNESESTIPTPEVGGGLWKQIKPKSGALQHSGLKWERIKEIVHHNLASERALERQDAARTLGLLRCADGMVLFALRKAMLTDEDTQTRYEATKALLLLGCWEENVIRSAIVFLKRGDTNVKVFLLQAMCKGKNVHFVDKGLPSFPKLSATLSHLCTSEEMNVAFHAAVCLGKLCVVDEAAKACLSVCIQTSTDHDRIIQACETLVRQMNFTQPLVVDTVLHQLRWSPSHKNRSLAARLLVLLGPRVVCPTDTDEDRIFTLLETRLWDDPMKDVRLDIAKAIIALDMFPRACERAERKLENPDEDVRGQAVMAIGTLGIRNERIIRTLLEMLELDPSEYIRILVIRTFGAIGLADKRIVRSLQEKEKLETMFANRSVISNEARKSLKLLQVS